MKDGYDSVMPSGNSVSVDVLARLARITKDSAYHTRADKTLAAFGGLMEQSPSGFSRMVLASEEVLRQPRTEVVAKPEADALIAANAPPMNKLTPREAPAKPAEKLVLFSQPTAAEAAKHQYVKGRMYLSADKLTPGSTVKVACVLDIAEGWHVNANPAKPDFVLPAELELTSAARVELTSIAYPQGKDLKMEDQTDPVSVYEGQVVILGTLKVPQDVKATSDDLKFVLRYQACNHKECLTPKRIKLDGKAAIGPGAKAINTKIFDPAK
jgi:uncharacterized protein